ncbi:MAG: hypothetical protein KAG37_05545, partial [Flavobacteriales bacterium]|nr:hypothetical protein [Flavobacteriales bacterium]
MKKLYAVSLLLVVSFFALDYYNNDITKNENNTKIPKLFSQKKSYVKGKIKKDSPNLFSEYYTQIKSEIGASQPNYSSNYLFTELQKAKDGITLNKKEDLNWVSRGPANVGGRSRGIIIDSDDATANTWFIAAVGGGVWKTSNAGVSWTELTSEKGSLSASYMAMAPSNHDVIYLGTGEGFGNLDGLGGQGIWKSTDRGITWNQLPSTTSKSFGIINRIIVDPNDENILLAATSISYHNSDESAKSGIYKSTDGGVNWVKKYEAPERVQQIICNPTDFNLQYAAVRGAGILKSDDAGETWKIVTERMTVGRIELAISPSNPKRLYASVDSSTPEIHISKDKGENWVKATGAIDFLGGQGWYDNAIIVDPYDQYTFYVAGVNIYKVKASLSGNLTFTTLTDNYGDDVSLHKGTHVDNHFFAAIKLDKSARTFRLVTTNDGGVCFTDDRGETFKQPTSGFITSQFYGVDKANGKDLYIGGMQDNSCYISPENPTSSTDWSFIFGGDGFDVVWNYEDENKVMFTSQYNNIAITHTGIDDLYNSGWLASVDNGSENAPFFTKLAQSKQFPDFVVTHGKNGIWRTEDFGLSWDNVKMPEEYSGDFSVNETKISLADPSIVWSGTSITPDYPLYVSTDFGKTFSVTSFATGAESVFSGFATHPVDVNTAYGLFSSAGNSKIMRTTDLGQNWSDITGFSSGTSSNGFP